MVRLNIPYRSQWDKVDANKYNADCGPTCAAMVLNYHNISATPNSIYADNFPNKDVREFTTFNELIGVFKKHQIEVGYRQASNKQEALTKLRTNMDAGRPMITLVNYRPWRQYDPIKRNDFNGGHFVVVTGYDEANIYMNDPLFGLWITPATKGAHFPMPIDIFCAGWAGFAANNPNWSYLLLGAPEGQATAVSQPENIVVPPLPPKPVPPEPAPASNAVAGTVMTDIDRRIRALAAYRWAEEPNLNDAAVAKLWRDHLGDWGLTYQKHVVQPGESYTVLANRFLGESHRWPAIQAYNTFTHDGLWVGETVLIPDLGQSGAHLDPTLPKDTVNFAKALNLDDLVDPDQTPMDYNDLWDDSINLGYVEAES